MKIMNNLKAIILAASPGDDNYFKILESLDNKKIIDHVVSLALQFVPPDDIYIVVGYRSTAVREHLGEYFHYVEQSELRGTGHAVLQVAEQLRDYDGNLLLLYGDTPLFRPSSILGMLNRHQMKNADLTLLTAVVSQPLPYGRIIRDANGCIVDVIEHVNASQTVRKITELNAGAYVVRARSLFPALHQLSQNVATPAFPLTDLIHRLIRSGNRVVGYRSYDPDEILGINTPADLEQAQFILEKRALHPMKFQQRNEIRFGTGGWRAVIAEGFTMDNVRRLCQSLANRIVRQEQESQGVLIGFDRRFLSDHAAEVAAEVFAGNNIPVTLLQEAAPTPLVTYVTEKLHSAYGLVFTASHNPPEWNGLKVFRQDGSLLPSAESDQIENEANALVPDDVVKIPLSLAIEARVIHRKDFSNDYIDAVERLIDLHVIREANLHVIIDPMHGVGQATLETILTEARCRVTVIHGRRDPLFGGHSPAPNLNALGQLITAIKDGRYDLGLAMDGDADRIAIVDENGQYIHINDILLLLYYYLHQTKNMKGGIVRNLATTHLLDRLASHFGEQCYETPVGFKHIIAGMQAHNALLGGESSGGLTIRGHILGKDGIFASALVVEMLAHTGKKISQLREQVYAITGRLYALEENLPATPEMKAAIPRRLRENPIRKIGAYPVLKILTLDGTKFMFENDNWLLLRFSGTEPVLRIFAEADTKEKAQELIHQLKILIGVSQ